MKLIKDCIVRVVEPKKAKKDKANSAPEENATPAVPEE